MICLLFQLRNYSAHYEKDDLNKYLQHTHNRQWLGQTLREHSKAWMLVWAPSCGRQRWSNFGERRDWQVGGCELGVNYDHLPLDQGLRGTAMAAGGALGAKSWLTFLLSPWTWAAPSRGDWKGTCCLCWTPAGRASRGWLWFPPEERTPLSAPQSSPSSRADERLRHTGHIGGSVGGVQAIIPQGISQEAHGSSRVDMSIPSCRNPSWWMSHDREHEDLIISCMRNSGRRTNAGEVPHQSPPAEQPLPFPFPSRAGADRAAVLGATVQGKLHQFGHWLRTRGPSQTHGQQCPAELRGRGKAQTLCNIQITVFSSMKTAQEQLQSHAALGNVLIGHGLFGGLGSDGPLQGLWISAPACQWAHKAIRVSPFLRAHLNIVFFWRPALLSSFLKLTGVCRGKNSLVLYQLCDLLGALYKSTWDGTATTQVAFSHRTRVLSTSTNCFSRQVVYFLRKRWQTKPQQVYKTIFVISTAATGPGCIHTSMD